MTTFMIEKETEEEEIDRRRIIDRYVSTYSTINLRGEREREEKKKSRFNGYLEQQQHNLMLSFWVSFQNHNFELSSSSLALA